MRVEGVRGEPAGKAESRAGGMSEGGWYGNGEGEAV